MIFVGDFFNIQGTKAQIGRVAYDSSAVEDLSKGILIDSIPDSIIPQGQCVSAMFIDTETKEITYTYEAIPLTIEQRMELMQQAIDALALV